MVWMIGVLLGFILPWIIRRNALWHAFSFFGVWSGVSLWGVMSIVTVPIGIVLAVVIGKVFG